MTHVTVSASVDIDDILSELDDDEIMDEVESRGLTARPGVDLADILRLLREGEVLDATLRIERALGINSASETAYASLRNGTHPFLRLNGKV
jgi:hypothetical protein